MAVRIAAEALDLHPWLDLCLDLGEGAAALAALPMLQTALTLAGAGEPVDPTPPTRFDSTGNQVFVGVARPVEPADDAVAASPRGTATCPRSAPRDGCRRRRRQGDRRRGRYRRQRRSTAGGTYPGTIAGKGPGWRPRLPIKSAPAKTTPTRA
jgi:hypothetical protein